MQWATPDLMNYHAFVSRPSADANLPRMQTEDGRSALMLRNMKSSLTEVFQDHVSLQVQQDARKPEIPQWSILRPCPGSSCPWFPES